MASCYVTFISAYALTMTNPEETKDKFYDGLQSIVEGLPKGNKLIVLGDVFTDIECSEDKTSKRIIGRNGVRKYNSNGLLLLKACLSHDLLIINIVYRLPNRNTASTGI